MRKMIIIVSIILSVFLIFNENLNTWIKLKATKKVYNELMTKKVNNKNYTNKVKNTMELLEKELNK